MVKEIKATGVCWVWAGGRIEFGSVCPDGALPMMSGDVKQMKELVEATARLAYPSATEQADVWLVPGVPEAADQFEAYTALMKWLHWIATSHKDDKSCNKIVFTVNQASNRDVRRKTARELNSKAH